MKKLFVLMVITIILMIASISVADDWYATNQVTVRWDAVTTLIDGSSVPEGDLVTYSLYARSVQSSTEILVVPGTSDVETQISFVNEGDDHIGIRAIRTVPAVGEIPERTFYSVIGWSDDPLVVKDGVTFGVSFYIPLSNVGGLGISPPSI